MKERKHGKIHGSTRVYITPRHLRKIADSLEPKREGRLPTVQCNILGAFTLEFILDVKAYNEELEIEAECHIHSS